MIFLLLLFYFISYKISFYLDVGHQNHPIKASFYNLNQLRTEYIFLCLINNF